MTSKQPFARRIVIAIVLLTVLVSGAFSLSIVAVVHFIEQRLISEEMHRELNGVLHEDLKNGRPPRLDAWTRFYASNLPEYAIPERYVGLDEGFTELVDNDQAVMPTHKKSTAYAMCWYRTRMNSRPMNRRCSMSFSQGSF